MKSLPKTYNPKQVEDRIYRLWQKSEFFNPDKLPGKRKRAFCVTMAPPNITGHIHVGHTLENTLLDILVRQKRMQGRKTLFLPGKDHAGIGAQYVLEKELKKEGLTRFDLGQEKFLERMWQWMKEYGDNIDNELKRIGLSCDWSRKRFTLDENYQKAVRKAFEHYKNKGWIYRDKRLVNWCPRCKTTISDLEVEYKQEKGKLWFIDYPIRIKNQESRIKNFITVATTRPETMLGDAAVAVNPEDKRYKNLIGKIAVLPIQNREIPIIADKTVQKNFGTGALKVTPAHNAFDFEIAKKHKLPFYYIINQDGIMLKEASICQGLSVKKCREEVLATLKSKGLLQKEKAHLHNVAICERCKTTIEPLVLQQWFLSMKELSRIALKAIKANELKFVPQKRKKIMIDWFNNVRDWNISRQLWWGHKIPIRGEKDVLDTWFSSALWPFATLGWPRQNFPKKNGDLKEFYPTTLISSAREIFFLWLSRMIFSGLEFMGKVPFETIYTHPTVLDKHGKKMSKSLGNVVDPMELIDKYGTDATRFGLVWQTAGTQDIHWSEDALLAGKKFCNKIWNATRFVLTEISLSNVKCNMSPKESLRDPTGQAKPNVKSQILTAADKKILKALNKTIESVNKELDNFQFSKAAQVLYDFFWHDFCDKYIEETKRVDIGCQQHAQKILLYVLLTSLKLLHPFMPFITEEIYQKLPIKNKKPCLMIEDWPK